MKKTIEKIKEVMEKRSSVRKYQKGKEIPKEVLNEVLRLAGTAPSSWNLQHWRFIVIEDQQRKESLLSVTNNQQQVVDSSVVIVVLGDTEANKNAKKIYKDAPEQVRDVLLSNIQNAYENVPNIGIHEAIRNASFASMQLMLAAKAFELDTCPIGGFNHQELIDFLNIPKRYIPVLMITIGYAEAPAHPTDRLPLEDIVIRETF